MSAPKITRDSAFSLQSSMTFLEYLFKATFKTEKKEDIDAMAKFIEPHSVVVDVGAHVGYFSRRFADHPNCDFVIAFEPQSAPRSIMNVAAFFQKKRNIVLLPLALGTHSGLIRLNIPIKKNNKVGIGLAHVGNSEDLENRFEVRHEVVPLYTMDEVLENYDVGRISLIKIDVEGGELDVLKGATKVLADHSPNVICEVGKDASRFDSTTNDLVAFMKAHGYTMCSLTDGEVIEDFSSENDILFKKLG